MSSITNLEPKALWKHFENISRIPHPSKHEDGVRDYIVNFAIQNGLGYEVDTVGNVVVRKEATSEMANRKILTLQGHIDMVPQKNNDKEFNFLTDSLSLDIKDGFVVADGTTLGADNGIGVAAALSILEDANLKHGQLEALFTIDEETGMTGVFGLKNNLLQGDILLNTDTETHGELCVGCAGGEDMICSLPIERGENAEGSTTLKIEVKGLKGGHSGMDISLQRANAPKIMARILGEVKSLIEFNLEEIEGGDIRNAIPREASAMITIKRENKDSAIKAIEASIEAIKFEYKEVEESISLEISETTSQNNPLTKECTSKVINLLNCHPNGVVRMSNSLHGLVESSMNLGVLKTFQDRIETITLLRSSIESSKKAMAQEVIGLFELAGGSCELSSSYSGWTPNLSSSILEVMKKEYNKLFGDEPHIIAVHAGLECGVIGAQYPNMEMISFGPTIHHPHSPDEKVEIESVASFYKLLVATIENAPLR